MKKGRFSKVTSVFLAILLLTNSLSYSFTKHFCKDEIVAVSHFGKIENCCKTTSADKPTTLNFSKKDCCKNVTEYKTIPSFDSEKPIKISLKKIDIVFSTVYNQTTVFNKIKQLPYFYKNFVPPDISIDIQALFQTYII